MAARHADEGQPPTERRVTPRIETTVHVPGPPRGRRRPLAGELVERALRKRDAETRPAHLPVRALLRFGADVILLLRDLMRDPRVCRADKVAAGLALVYVLSPVDLVPDTVPFAGKLDDVSVAVLGLRRLLARSGYDIVYELWRGSDEGLAFVLAFGGVRN